MGYQSGRGPGLRLLEQVGQLELTVPPPTHTHTSLSASYAPSKKPLSCNNPDQNLVGQVCPRGPLSFCNSGSTNPTALSESWHHSPGDVGKCEEPSLRYPILKMRKSEVITSVRTSMLVHKVTEGRTSKGPKGQQFSELTCQRRKACAC